MKTVLIALFVSSIGTAFGQITDSAPPTTGTRTTAHLVRHRLPQPTPPPVGFWVLESTPGHKAVVHFYTNAQHELLADTLPKKWVNLKKRAVVEQLNERLAGLLSDESIMAQRIRK